MTGMTSAVRTRGLAAALTVSLGLVVGLGAAGCSGSDGQSDATSAGPASSSGSAEASAGSSATPAPSAAPYLPVPDGVTLSDQGSTLSVGDTATVAWQPRQDVTGVIDVTIDRLEKTTLGRSFSGWKIPKSTQDSKPYFVRATVVNRGATDVGGRPVPLYIVDGSNTLIEATSFASVFKPCRHGVFPESFPAGATAQVCLVYFAPTRGALTAVSFRPTQEFNPITWTGELKTPKGSKARQARRAG
jgi:hypothetical protein